MFTPTVNLPKLREEARKGDNDCEGALAVIEKCPANGSEIARLVLIVGGTTTQPLHHDVARNFAENEVRDSSVISGPLASLSFRSAFFFLCCS